LFPRPQAATINKFRDEILSSFVFADVQDCQYMRVIQSRGSLRLTLKAAAGGQVGKIGGEELNSRAPLETVDRSHAACAERSLDAVWPQNNTKGNVCLHQGFCGCVCKSDE
jgi:hypothetical protein